MFPKLFELETTLPMKGFYRMSDQNSQDSSKSKKNYDSGQGGFVAVLHSLEKEFYGPESPFDARAKVMLYIRHRALRDYQTTKQIPKSEIMEATGLKPTALKDALRDLEKKKFILVTRTKVGKVWGDNIYELHPQRYGTDYVYRPEKPSFKVIYGSKGHKSNKKPKAEDIHRTGGTYPHDEKLGRDSDLGVGRDSNLGVPLNTDLGEGVNNSESFGNSSPKNPLKEPIKRTLSESDSEMNNSGDSRAKDEAIAAIHRLVGNGLRSMPR
jgi:hypothetical protein